MEPTFLKKYGILFILAAIGAGLFSALLPRVSPLASLDLHYHRTEIMKQAREYLVSLGYDLKDYQQDAVLTFDGTSHAYLQRLYGMERANEIVRKDSLALHNWNVTWYDRTASKSQNMETFSVMISPAGKINGFEHTIKDSVSLPSVNLEEARTMAETFLAKQHVDLSSYTLRTSSDIKQVHRIDYRFVWATGDTSVESRVWVRVQGNEIGGFMVTYAPAGEFQTTFTQIATMATLLVTASFAVVFLLFFFIVILFLKKYHEGEVGTATGIRVFIGLFAVALISSINVYPVIGQGTGVGDLNQFNVRLVVFVMSVFILHVFLNVMAFAGWSVGESSSRSVWPGKMSGVDSALANKFLTLELSHGVLTGYCWGLILLGGYAAVVALMETYGHVMVVSLAAGDVVHAYLPPLQPVLEGIGTAAFAEVVFRLFFISYIKEKTHRTWLGVLISTLLWTVTAFTMWEIPFGQPGLYFTFPALFLFGLVLSYLFLRYDLLTTLTANFVVVAMSAAIPLFVSTEPYFREMQWIFLVLMALPLLVAAGGFIRRGHFEFTLQTLPQHIRRISERERMAKELEIARNVQMSLLPKSNPMREGFDIAGICIPAQEVGGDYYDFVNLGGKQIGIAIGDVSGKGVPAAIYMTLTKGILQSHAEDNVSPKIVLSKVNSLMYRTIERNSFVSMFYAVLDPPHKTIRFARAGQCPVILAHHVGEQGSFLTPKGMALGLERGDVFDAVLEEREMKLESGAILVFYTDGFTEAMNAKGDEFGEARLAEAVARQGSRSASDIIKGVCSEVRDFTGDTPQHDDMTMVVLKVA